MLRQNYKITKSHFLIILSNLVWDGYSGRVCPTEREHDLVVKFRSASRCQDLLLNFFSFTPLCALISIWFENLWCELGFICALFIVLFFIKTAETVSVQIPRPFWQWDKSKSWWKTSPRLVCWNASWSDWVILKISIPRGLGFCLSVWTGIGNDWWWV